MVELRSIDICRDVYMMSINNLLPREGHLEQMYYVLVYMKKYHNSELVFYPSDQVIDQAEFERQYCTSS